MNALALTGASCDGFVNRRVGSSSLPACSEFAVTSGATLRAERAIHRDLLRHAAQGQWTDALEPHAVA